MPTFQETMAEVQAWWTEVRSKAAGDYAPGKFLRLPTGVTRLTAFHCNIEQLYVRAIFPALFKEIIGVLCGEDEWQLCHLCGNSGVGKSAFVWYFIVRVGIEDPDAFIIYESGPFVWEFRGPAVRVVPKADFSITLITEDVKFHLIDQKADYGRPLGARVLVAASPDTSNVKDAKKFRTSATLYMPAWSKEEYFVLVDSWRKRAGNPPNKVAAQRLDAAEMAFEWFGGIPRFLLDARPSTLTQKHFEAEIFRSLSNTKLKNVSAVLQQGANCPNVSWRLFHFKLARDSFENFHYTFCSDKVAGLYSYYLCNQNHDKIKSFLDASQPFPEYGSLRGFVFEQYVIGQALHQPLMALPLIDDVYCRHCLRKNDAGRNWIECDHCRGWYHVTCARAPTSRFQCKNCNGPAKTASVSDGNLLLRYYDGDLEDALLAAGEGAVNYVWRPLRKNNAVFDFVVLPYTLAQVTVSKSHPASLQALVNGLKALRAWRQEFGPFPERDDMLLYLVPPDIFSDFQFQQYRGASRKLSQVAVQGLVQCKVAVPVNGSPYVGFDLGSAAAVPVVPLDLNASLETLERNLNCVESEELVEESAERSLEEEKKAMKRRNWVSDSNLLEGLDFRSMKRRRLQALCKEHKIPANTTNEEMISNLTTLQQKS